MDLSISELNEAVALRLNLKNHEETLKKIQDGELTTREEIINARIQSCVNTPPKVLLGALDLADEQLRKSKQKIEKLESELKVCWAASTFIFLYFFVTLYSYRLSKSINKMTLLVDMYSNWLFATRHSKSPHLRLCCTRSSQPTKTRVWFCRRGSINSIPNKRDYCSKPVSTYARARLQSQTRSIRRAIQTRITPSPLS